MDDLEVRLRQVAGAQDGVLSRRDVLRLGGDDALVRRRTRSGEWEVLLPGVVLAEPWRTGLERQRARARAAVLAVPGAVLGRGTAAVLHGVEGVPATGRVDLLVDRHLRAGARPLSLVQAVVPASHVVDLRGLPVTAVARTLADLLPRLGRLEALAVLDSALHSGAATREDLAVAERLAAGRRGGSAVADLWALADGRAETPLESRARLRCLDSGLVPHALQHVVRTPSGRFVARCDLAFRRRDPRLPPLLLEADGAGPHSTPDALHRDRARANALVALGHPVVRVTWADTCRQLAVPDAVRAAL